ncbi:MAG: hypothetical protein CMI02_12930 [Oceanospirillaceae bacterium]|nr:hypothetical protein [Oceanospirillaceae bacterium]MBT12925.1 hypothetical protein [Oceanospirillaceae bacterium]|tara:strand:+ start:27445 stop:28119 length:675 start_codon:yes stop_codon:yes gene_type:complete
MNQLRYWWRHPKAAGLISLYRQLSGREQKLMQVTLAVVLAALVLWLATIPVWQQIQLNRQQQQQANQEYAHLQARLKALHDSRRVDPDQAVRDELARLKTQQSLLDERINTLTRALVSPGQMTSLLADMLTQNKDLITRSLQTLPAERVNLGDGYDDVQLFRHSLQLTLDVTFPALVTYLQELDRVPWLLGWESLEFNIEDYPRGQVVLLVSTLSRRQEVLGSD